MLLNCEACTIESKMVGGQVPCYVPPTSQYNVLFVGQAPGKTEVLTGRPFTGPAGKMLFALMKEAGLSKLQIPQTNICLCKPPDDGKGNDRTPTSHEAFCCQNHLIEELAMLQPQLVVGFGGFTCQQLTGKHDLSIMSSRGSFLELDPKWEYGCPVLCCLHPSFVMRQRQWIPVAIKDLLLVTRFFVEGIPTEEDYKFILDPTVEELKEYLYSTDSIVDFDTETTGLHLRQDNVIGASFSISPHSACAVAFKDKYDPRIEVVAEWLSNPTIPKSAQNGSFDCEILFNSLGIEVRGLCYDTRLGEQLLSSDTPKDLDHLRAVYTKITPYKPSKKQRSEMASWGKDRMLTYACWDAVTTHQVRLAQKKLLSPLQNELIENLLIPLIPAINLMERKGVKVDVPTLAMTYADIIPKAEALYSEVEEAIGININSPKQIMDTFHIKSSDREELEGQIQRGHSQSDILQKILDYRDIHKGASTFLRGVYQRLEDGYVHTHYKIEGTGTGRLSSSDPNLQNIQEPYRAIFIPEDGCVFFSIDYKQLELWVAAVLAEDILLLKDLQSDVDIHNAVLQEMEPYMPERLLISPKVKRVAAKNVVFGTLYGRSARSIAIAYAVPVEMAKKWQNICFDKYPGLQRYVEKQTRAASNPGYVDSPFGRRRYVQTAMQAINTPIQNTASDITLSSLLIMHQEGFDLRLTVHDSIVLQVKEGEEEPTYKRVKTIVERSIPQLKGVNLKATYEVGYNWYEMEKYLAKEDS